MKDLRLACAVLALAGPAFGQTLGTGFTYQGRLQDGAGSSTGAFTTVGLRQQLRPSPNALFSTAAPWSGVTGKPAGFADGITTSIAIGVDGLPIVSHGESTGSTLRIVKCGNAGCQQ
jgi:hypothetical protein